MFLSKPRCYETKDPLINKRNILLLTVVVFDKFIITSKQLCTTIKKEDVNISKRNVIDVSAWLRDNGGSGYQNKVTNFQRTLALINLVKIVEISRNDLSHS